MTVTSVGNSVTESVLLSVAEEKQKKTVFPKRGKKVDKEFEARVLARCMDLAATKALQGSSTLADDAIKPGFTAELLANVLYKYDVVVLAAQEELKDKKWENKKAVKRCVILLVMLRCYVHIYSLKCVITFLCSIYVLLFTSASFTGCILVLSGWKMFSSAFALPDSEL